MQIHGKGKCKNAEDLAVCSSQMTTGQKQGEKCSTVLKKISKNNRGTGRESYRSPHTQNCCIS